MNKLHSYLKGLDGWVANNDVMNTQLNAYHAEAATLINDLKKRVSSAEPDWVALHRLANDSRKSEEAFGNVATKINQLDKTLQVDDTRLRMMYKDLHERYNMALNIIDKALNTIYGITQGSADMNSCSYLRPAELILASNDQHYSLAEVAIHLTLIKGEYDSQWTELQAVEQQRLGFIRMIKTEWSLMLCDWRQQVKLPSTSFCKGIG
jgi:hypothetical protein